MRNNLSSLGLAASLVATAACHKKVHTEQPTGYDWDNLSAETSASPVASHTVQPAPGPRDMSHAAPFELSGEVKYGEEIPRETLQKYYGYDKAGNDLHVAGSGLDIIQKGTRKAVVLAIIATNSNQEEMATSKEPDRLLDPNAVPVGRENSGIWIQTVIPPVRNAEIDPTYGTFSIYCLSADGQVRSVLPADLVTGSNAGHGRWRAWAFCADEPGRFGVKVVVDPRDHLGSLVSATRYFNAVEAVPE